MLKAASVSVELTIPQPTAKHLKQAIAQQYPPLAQSIPTSRVAVNHAYVRDAAFISADDELALIGLISGG